MHFRFIIRVTALQEVVCRRGEINILGTVPAAVCTASIRIFNDNLFWFEQRDSAGCLKLMFGYDCSELTPKTMRMQKFSENCNLSARKRRWIGMQWFVSLHCIRPNVLTYSSNRFPACASSWTGIRVFWWNLVWHLHFENMLHRPYCPVPGSQIPELRGSEMGLSGSSNIHAINAGDFRNWQLIGNQTAFEPVNRHWWSRPGVSWWGRGSEWDRGVIGSRYRGYSICPWQREENRVR